MFEVEWNHAASIPNRDAAASALGSQAGALAGPPGRNVCASPFNTWLNTLPFKTAELQVMPPISAPITPAVTPSDPVSYRPETGARGLSQRASKRYGDRASP